MFQPARGLPQSLAPGLTKPLLKFRAAEAESPAVMLALAVMAGCALYFSRSFQPDAGLWIGAVIVLAGTVCLVLLMTRFGQAGRPNNLLLALVVLAGIGLGLWRSDMRSQAFEEAPVIASGQRAIGFQGWLESVDRNAQGRSRLLIAIPASDGHPAYRVRVLGNAGDQGPGDWISVRAVVEPPRQAVMPGGYDGAFQAYFQRLAATGYAVETARAGPVLVSDDPLLAARQGLARFRASLADHIRHRLPGRSGGVAAALLSGDRSGIDRADVEALRAAGLGHLLAISGLHMALLAGGLFFAIRAGLAGFTRWSRAHDPARPAALLALIAALAYLLLSGAAIPTQRAFIMTAAMLGAVILRRRALSFHTLAMAVLLVLMLRPEAILSPGFQMSFAAVTALMATAQAWQARRQPRTRFSDRGVVRDFLGGLATTSLVAGLATGGFAAFHFHRMASFGLAGNLMVMPVFSLLVMPAGILGLCLMPFGLDAVPLWIMGWGIDRVLDVSHWVASWPGALQPLAGAPGWVLAVYTAGFLVLLLTTRRNRLVGLCLMGMAGLAWAQHAPADIFITGQGVVVTRDTPSGDWQVSDARRDRFAVRVFLESVAETERPGRAVQACDQQGCRLDAGDGALRIVHLDRPEQWREDCRRADLLILHVSLPDHVQRQCGAMIADLTRPDAWSPALIWLGEAGIQRLRQVQTAGSLRPWQDRPRLRLPRIRPAQTE
ncbi:ComEC/Rec2 family competence protein [Maricaulis parjimensis]|uniref:ComEC/Rec2 family competence protein n=1 Tax=Maricaulis parjimensis TaxID=144023 RepID=UPI00193A87F7|nr:ComEC/Rec2 family competence protein [Maricaulis parjimensis]